MLLSQRCVFRRVQDEIFIFRNSRNSYYTKKFKKRVVRPLQDRQRLLFQTYVPVT